MAEIKKGTDGRTASVLTAGGGSQVGPPSGRSSVVVIDPAKPRFDQGSKYFENAVFVLGEENIEEVWAAENPV